MVLSYATRSRAVGRFRIQRGRRPSWMRDRQTASDELHTARPSNIRPLSFIFIPHASIFMNFCSVFWSRSWRNSEFDSVQVTSQCPVFNPRGIRKAVFNARWIRAHVIQLKMLQRVWDKYRARIPVHPHYFSWWHVVGSTPSPSNFFRMTVCRGFESQSSQLFSDDFMSWVRIPVQPTFFGWC